jgi:hypothetical protein
MGQVEAVGGGGQAGIMGVGLELVVSGRGQSGVLQGLVLHKRVIKGPFQLWRRKTSLIKIPWKRAIWKVQKVIDRNVEPLMVISTLMLPIKGILERMVG